MATVRLTEAAVLAEAGTAGPGASARYRARIIEGDRWGSSGYYSREVLERDGPNAWPSGTAIFLDHPGETERMDRPERSVRDLAGRLSTTPVYEGDGLYAEVEFYPHVAPIIAAMHEHVGLSIRAAAEAEHGEAEGQSGVIITKLVEGVSVDVVTRAGAGGKLVSLLESARGAVESVENAITNESPVNPAGQSEVTESPREGTVMEIEESRFRALETDAGRVPTLITERDTAVSEAETLRAENARMVADLNRSNAARIVHEAAASASVDLDKWQLAGLTATVPLTEAGVLDETTYAATVATEVAAIMERAGSGTVRGMGGSGTGTTEVAEADVNNIVAGAFGRTAKGA